MKNSEPAILILTGSFGHGHNTAARNLETAFRRQLGAGAEVEVVDFFAESFPRANGLLRDGYAFAINSAPGIWRQLYRLAEVGGNGLMPFRAIHRQFERMLEERKPTAVVATFPGYPLLFKKLYPNRQDRPFPIGTVITDAISINAVWCHGDADLLFVTDTWSKDIVGQEGIAGDRIRPHGFPLSMPPGEALARLVSLPEASPRLLYLATTRTRHVEATLRELAPWCRRHGAHLTLVLGQHEARLRPVAEACCGVLSPDLLTVHGWRDDVPLLMRQHHLTVTKAGGASVSETLGAECPVLLNYVVPGQEEGNVELVERSECGQRVKDVVQLASVLSQILIDDGAAVWRRYRENLRALDRAKASQRIVDDVLGLLH